MYPEKHNIHQSFINVRSDDISFSPPRSNKPEIKSDTLINCMDFTSILDPKNISENFEKNWQITSSIYIKNNNNKKKEKILSFGNPLFSIPILKKRTYGDLKILSDNDNQVSSPCPKIIDRNKVSNKSVIKKRKFNSYEKRESFGIGLYNSQLLLLNLKKIFLIE